MKVIPKRYPDDYGRDVLTVLRTMAFGKDYRVVGSQSIRGQIYAGDVDAYEVYDVKGSVENLAKQFQTIVRNVMKLPSTFVSDIKCGSVEEWKVVPETAVVKNGRVFGYNADEIKAKVQKLADANVISEAERDASFTMLKKKPTAVEFLFLRKALRFNVLRWTPKEIFAGYKTLQDGRKFPLTLALTTPTITKLDVVSWIGNTRFTDFEMIYEFHKNGKVLNKGIDEVDKAISENILMLEEEGNFFKMAKRMFAYAKFKGWSAPLEPLSKLFTSDLGMIYMVYGDVKTLEELILNESYLPKAKLNFEIDQFRVRLANVTLPEYLKKETHIMEVIKRLDNMKLYTRNNAEMLKLLRKMQHYLSDLLNKYTIAYLKKHNLYPIQNRFLP